MFGYLTDLSDGVLIMENSRKRKGSGSIWGRELLFLVKYFSKMAAIVHERETYVARERRTRRNDSFHISKTRDIHLTLALATQA